MAFSVWKLLLIFVVYQALTEQVHGIYKTPAAILTGEGVCSTTFTRTVVYLVYQRASRYLCGPYNTNCRVFYFIVTGKQYRTEQVVTAVCCDGFYEVDNCCVRNVTVSNPPTPVSPDGRSIGSSPMSNSVAAGLSTVIVVLIIATSVAVILKFRRRKNMFEKKSLTSTPSSEPSSPDPLYVQPNRRSEYLNSNGRKKITDTSINNAEYDKKIKSTRRDHEESRHSHYAEVDNGKSYKIGRALSTKMTQLKSSIKDTHEKIKTQLTESSERNKSTNRTTKRLPSLPKIPESGRTTLRHDISIDEFKMTQNTAYGMNKQQGRGQNRLHTRPAKENYYTTVLPDNGTDKNKATSGQRPPNYDDVHMYASYASLTSIGKEEDATVSDNSTTADDEHSK